MNRRAFLSLLGTAAAVAAIDPERLLWTPSQTTHILPPANGWRVSLSPPMSIRFMRKFDLTAGHVSRLDVVYGVGTLRPELARPDEAIRSAAQAIAAHIDMEAVRFAYQRLRDQFDLDAAYFRGDTWPNELRRV